MGHPNDPFLGHPPTGRSFCLAVTQRPWFFGSNDLHGVAGVCWQGHRDRTISLVPDGPKPEPHIATAWLISHVPKYCAARCGNMPVPGSLQRSPQVWLQPMPRSSTTVSYTHLTLPTKRIV